MRNLYGPYTNREGRKFVIHIEPDGRRRTQSYPRYLIEQFLGRELESWETVDHINEDFTDDRIENYQLLTRAENVSKSMRLRRPAEVYEFACPVCSEWTRKPARIVRKNRKAGCSGPYCGKRCARQAQLSKAA